MKGQTDAEKILGGILGLGRTLVEVALKDDPKLRKKVLTSIDKVAKSPKSLREDLKAAAHEGIDALFEPLCGPPKQKKRKPASARQTTQKSS